MNLAETLKLRDIEAGGPGSGRKPAWTSSSSNHKNILDSMHETFLLKGLKYTNSVSLPKSGAVTHYYKGDGQKGTITENGENKPPSKHIMFYVT